MSPKSLANDNLSFDCESLESRRLLAGDVTVFARGDDVIVRGDNADNSISIFVASSNQIRIRGVAGTTVNGSSETTVRLEDDLRIDLRNGANTIVLGDTGSSLSLPDDLIVRFGRDGSTISGRIDVAGDVSISSSGRLSVNLSGQMGDDVRVVSRGEASILFEDSIIDGDLRILTRAGDDRVELIGLTVGDDVVINTGAGSDVIAAVGSSGGPVRIGGDLRLVFGSGNDTGRVIALVDGDTFINEGPGVDDIQVNA